MNRGERLPFSELHHIAVVVRDLTQAVNYYSSVGIGPFESYPPIREYVRVDVPDESAFYDLQIRVAQIGPVSLQIIQPSEGRTIYGDFLENRGEGVFHLGFRVDDIEREEAYVKQLGLKVLSSGRRADGSGFTYFDTAGTGGFNLLIRQNPPEKK